MTLYIVAFRQGQQAFQSILGAIGAMYEHNLYMSNLFEYLRRSRDVGHAALAGSKPASGVACAAEAARRILFEGRRVPLSRQGRSGRCAGLDPTIADGRERRARRRERRGQDDAHQAPHAACTSRPRGACCSTGETCARGTRRRCAARFGVVFQDFNQYQLKVRENVGFGSVDHMEDEPRIARAVERRRGARRSSALTGGLDAPLGRWFQDGTELSGGQWQKIALARAFMREEADILVLDEPTASLDAEAEHAVFERFRALAAGTDRPAEQGARTTIVISHRFPTVRMAPRIVVLEKGRIVEEGSHEALVAHGGKYARMFALQAEGYR